jgi:3-oxoacyl-[acyl-carrier-protein] synthase-1
MTAQIISINRTALLTSVGLTAPAACAAIRAKVTNPIQTRFIDATGEWIMAHAVQLENPWVGRTRLAKMASIVIKDCLAETPRDQWAAIPLLLCVAERDRPGRLEGLDDALFDEVQTELELEAAPQSLVIPHGRASVGNALLHARSLIADGVASNVVIAAADSLLNWQTLSAYDRSERLLTPTNSNGFMPGEGAAAVLVGAARTQPTLRVCGLGFATEPATIDREEPLLGEGLASAIKNALKEAGCALHELDYRISDISGEQYYFKEAALALARVLRQRKETFAIWHPAECIGETGATAGIAALVVTEAACRKAYSPGNGILCHVANDGGQRGAIVLRYAAN